MTRILQRIFNNELYTLVIVAIALISLLVNLPTWLDLTVDGLFLLDLIVASLLYVKLVENKSLKDYLFHHTFDILAVIPVQFFSFAKVFRLVRLVRVSRLAKLTRFKRVSVKITPQTIFRISSLKVFAIYLLIYLVGNVYVFKECLVI